MKPTIPKPPRPLNHRQEKVVALVAGGMSGTEAWMQAGYRTSRDVARRNASEFLTRPDIQARIAEIRSEGSKQVRRFGELTVARKLEILAEIAETPIGSVTPDSLACAEYVEEIVTGGTRGKLRRGKAASGDEGTGETVVRRKIKGIDRIRAMELHSKLANHFAPEQVIVETGPVTLETIKEIAARIRVASPLLLHRLTTAGRMPTRN